MPVPGRLQSRRTLIALLFALVAAPSAFAAASVTPTSPTPTSPTGAAAAPATLSGSCQFSGPIKPTPPITVVPKPGAHFSYAGTGTCTGKLDGAAVKAAPITVTFTNVATVFDTCELGPDFNLTGTLRIEAGGKAASFTITISLARLALAGPFTLSTPGGGSAAGTAQFTPTNVSGALQQCATTGVSTATLSGSFNTLSPLSGSDDPVSLAPPTKHKHKHKHTHGKHRHRR